MTLYPHPDPVLKVITFICLDWLCSSVCNRQLLTATTSNRYKVTSRSLVIRNLFNAQQDTVLLNNVDQGAYLTYQIGFN